MQGGGNVLQLSRCRERPGRHQHEGVRVPERHLAIGVRGLLQRILPAVGRSGEPHLVDQPLMHAIQQLGLVLDVVVQGHGPDAKLVRNRTHADRFDAAGVREGDGRLNYLIPAQRHSLLLT